ncbi:putative UDP-galactose transporter, partial [Operophtera brumata]
MKSEVEESDISGEPVVSPNVKLEEPTAATQLTSESMDGDTKKTLATTPSRRTGYRYIKYVSLVVLTVQNAALGLSMRYARTRDVEMFSSAAAVLMAELFKLIICVGLVILESGGVEKGAQSMYNIVILNVQDTLRVCVPSFLYIVQNNLLYVSASNLDAATYQVTYQLKILTTAFFAVVVLKKALKRWQWCALALLATGVALVQLSSTETKSVWMRNVQLSLLSLPFGACTYLIKEGTTQNLLKGFDGFVWYLVVLQAAGGLIVAVVVKYADNILKGFATSFAIVISCVVSMYIFDFVLTVQFAMGTLLVTASIFLYGYVPKKPEPRNSLSV